MTASDPAGAVDERLARLAGRLLAQRAARDHWEGVLSSSALSTATAVLALHLCARHRPSARATLEPLVDAGAGWLVSHQNRDGGWGDTTRSRSNISTTAIAWAVLSLVAPDDAAAARERSESWLRAAAGDVSPDALRSAMLRRYGRDHTFSVPVLMVLALTGKLGPDMDAAWRSVPQLPFEVAALPHRWFRHLRLPVVSYALPALIAIGQVRHRLAPSRNPIARLLRNGVRERTHRLLRAMQPESGGYLEAAPLTSFVIMGLVAAARTDSPVVEAGTQFLVDAVRTDGSWPIDTNLSTWVTTLSVCALGESDAVPDADRSAIRRWLLRQQSVREHPFTHAAAGGWAWTDLSGGVPDADDASGALLALRLLGEPDDETTAAAAAGARWLLGVQNRDGGIPTFCRGWGALPFDRSTPEITAHALRAWSAWGPSLNDPLQRQVRAAAARALGYLERSQHPDGRWVPLWFGNEAADDEENAVYGTARVLLGMEAALVRDDPRAARCRAGAARWLLDAQNADGGWGGGRALPSSVEETGVVLSALSGVPKDFDPCGIADAIAKGVRWLVEATGTGQPAATPIGLYFARLWYFEELYPLVFAVEGLGRARARNDRARDDSRAHARETLSDVKGGSPAAI